MYKTRYKIKGAFESLSRNKRMLLMAVVIIAAFVAGLALRSNDGQASVETISHDDHAHAASEEPSAWTCSMHPQVQLPKAGKCPICFMDLIPVESDSGIGESQLDPRQLRMTPAAMKLADIQTSPVIRADAEMEIRLPGRVAYDETRVAQIAAWVPGRITKLYADYTGVVVKRGEPMVELYSPALYSAQKELLSAVELMVNLKQSSSSSLMSTAQTTLDAARKKLMLLGLTQKQVDDLEASGLASEYVTVSSPTSGIVIEKKSVEGEYVATGTHIYTIADLSQVWVMLDAFESDLPWIREGQTATFSTASFPGEVFEGTVAFIDPVFDNLSRTLGVRMEVENSDLKLKPDMLVNAQITSASKTRTASSHEYNEVEGEGMLMIPATAPLITGKRAVVYVRLPDRDEPVFEGREVMLGPRSGDFYVVKSGLSEADVVVTNGAFKIDAELQIRAKPSMMNPTGGGPAPVHQHGGNGTNMAMATTKRMTAGSVALEPVYESYFKIQTALAADEHNSAVSAYQELLGAVEQIDMNEFNGEQHQVWMEFSGAAAKSTAAGEKSTDLVSARDAFYHLSKEMIALHESFGHSEKATYYLAFCPMARDNQGAYWLQTDNIINNSYWGAAMLRCGEIRGELPPADKEANKP